MTVLQSIPRIANVPRAVASGPTAEQVQTQSLAGGTDRPEVEISASARVRAAARAELLGKDGGFGSTFGERRPELEATRTSTAPRAGLVGSSDAGAGSESSGDAVQELERSQLVAVRVGVAPPPILGEGVTVTEAGLRQRAVLRDLGSLFTLPELDAERREASDVQGRSDTAAGREAAQKIELLGDPAKPEPQPSDALGEPEKRQPGRAPASSFAARDASAPRPSPTPESERAAELAGTQSPEIPVLGDPEQPDATTSIPAAVAGAVRDPGAALRPLVLPGSGKSESDSAVRPAERVASQFGAVEADGGEELIARFLGDPRSEDRSRGDAGEPSRAGDAPVRDSGGAAA